MQLDAAMKALVGVVALVVLPGVVAYLASRLPAIRKRVALRVLAGVVAFLLTAAADLILRVNTGLISP